LKSTSKKRQSSTPKSPAANSAQNLSHNLKPIVVLPRFAPTDRNGGLVVDAGLNVSNTLPHSPFC
jgi:hypothetical protein